MCATFALGALHNSPLDMGAAGGKSTGAAAPTSPLEPLMQQSVKFVFIWGDMEAEASFHSAPMHSDIELLKLISIKIYNRVSNIMW